jgi:hypothetical protein
MFLTNDEMKFLRDSIELQAGFDVELIKACSNLVHIQAFDEAVRAAFVILEEKMRNILNKPGATGFQMAQYAFSTNGPFTKLLSHNLLEYEGTRDLFFGAFRLYRNPSAHTSVGYTAGEARSILSLVNLLLIKLNELGLIPQPGTFSENIEKVLQDLELQVGVPTITRVRVFLKQCEKLNMHYRLDAKQWIPFRKHALVQGANGKPPKVQQVTVFYLSASHKEHGLWFPVNQYYTQIIGINKQKILSALWELGFKPIGQTQDAFIGLKNHNSQVFFENLYKIVTEISLDFEATVKSE